MAQIHAAAWQCCVLLHDVIGALDGFCVKLAACHLCCLRHIIILDLDISSTSCMSETSCMSSQPHMSVSLTGYILVAWQYTQYGSMSRQNDHSGCDKAADCCRGGAVGVVVMGLNLTKQEQHPCTQSSLNVQAAFTGSWF